MARSPKPRGKATEDESRLSRPTGGTAASVSDITSADLADYHRATLGPVGGTVVVAGDLSEVDVEREL